MVTFEYIVQHNDFILALCTFLDEYKRTENKDALLAMPPPEDGVNKENLCLLAAVAHKLANDNGRVVPAWVHDDKYVMPYPVYAFNTKNEEYQAFLREDTPYEFASKNIFHGANAINRT